MDNEPFLLNVAMKSALWDISWNTFVLKKSVVLYLRGISNTNVLWLMCKLWIQWQTENENEGTESG